MENEILIRRAEARDAAGIYTLMRRVYEALEDKSLFVCDELDYIEEHISGKGFAVVACAESVSIVGSFIFAFPGTDENNLGRDIALPEPELEKVIHVDSAVVAPEYRGRGLQLKMLRFAEGLIGSAQRRYLLATVSPDNPASFRTLEKNGYEAVLTKEKYGGLLRRIYLKTI